MSIHASTLSNMNISETNWPINIKFHLEHHLGGELVALAFGLYLIRSLVSMATNNSRSYNVENLVTTLAPFF